MNMNNNYVVRQHILTYIRQANNAPYKLHLLPEDQVTSFLQHKKPNVKEWVVEKRNLYKVTR